MSDVLQGVMIPFIGTSLGAACVFPMRKDPAPALERSLSGFAAGVMTAAGVWSLLLPAIEGAARLGRLAFLPAAVGLMLGTALMRLLDKAVKHLCSDEGRLPRNTMTALSVTLHNIPEGMVVGAAFAGMSCGGGNVTAAAATALAVGIAIQNFPEGAMISMPLKAEGMTRRRAFVIGVLSGAVEPVGAALTFLAAGLVTPAMPYLLSLAAGAMFSVVAEELLTEPGRALPYSAGFALMMSLDVLFS